MTNSIAFSTLACPDWNLTEIIEGAVRYGYDAVELRGYLTEMDLPRAEPFTPSRRAATRRQFEDAGIAVCCVGSSGVVAQGNVDHVRAHAALARDLNCPYVRVFGGNLPEGVAEDDALNTFADTLRAFGDAAQTEGVQIVLETHDAFSTGASVAELLTRTDHPAVFALWDLHHPHRQGEKWPDALRHLLPFLRHVHVKDGNAHGYTLPNEDGDVPLPPMIAALTQAGYTGALSLEWEKRWHPDLPDPDVALPAYAAYLNRLPLDRPAGAESELPKTARLTRLYHEVKSLFPNASLGGDDDFAQGLFLLEIGLEPYRFTMTSERRGYGVSCIREQDIPEVDLSYVQDEYLADFDSARIRLLEIMKQKAG